MVQGQSVGNYHSQHLPWPKFWGQKTIILLIECFGNGNMVYIEMTKYLGIPKLSSYEFHYFVSS